MLSKFIGALAQHALTDLLTRRPIHLEFAKNGEQYQLRVSMPPSGAQPQERKPEVHVYGPPGYAPPPYAYPPPPQPGYGYGMTPYGYPQPHPPTPQAPPQAPPTPPEQRDAPRYPSNWTGA